MSSVAPEPIRTDQDLRRLQSAARELGIETWRILQTFPTLSPSSNGTSSSQNEFTVRELLKYQSSAKRLGLPFWKVLQSLTPEGSEADTPSSLRPIADNGLSAEGSPISLDHSSHQNDSGGAEQYVNGASLSADFLGENVLRLSGEVEQAGQTEQAGQIEEGEDPFGQKILGHRKLLLICLELSGVANDNFSSTLGQAPLNTLVSQPWFNPDTQSTQDAASSEWDSNLLPNCRVCGLLLFGVPGQATCTCLVPDLPICSNTAPSTTYQTTEQGYGVSAGSYNRNEQHSNELSSAMVPASGVSITQVVTANKKRKADVLGGLQKAKQCRQRSVKSCIHCRSDHNKCLEDPNDPTGDCLGCKKKGPKVSNIGCLFVYISDAILFRSVVDPITNRPWTLDEVKFSFPNPIRKRDSKNVKRIELSQGCKTPLVLSVCEGSLPVSGEHLISDPTTHGIFRDPYSLVDPKEAEKTIRLFVKQSLKEYYIRRAGTQDSITNIVFQMATSVKANTYLPRKVIELWVAARYIEGGWRIRKPETLNLRSDIHDLDGTCLLTDAPRIDQQFAAIVVREILLPLRKEVLQELQRLYNERGTCNWLVIFLASYVILHSYGLLMRQQRAFARLWKSQFHYSNMNLIRDLLNGAKIILIYFHRMNNGRMPFERDWSLPETYKGVASLAELDDRQLGQMQQLVREVKKRSELFVSLAKTQDYEADHWFTGQLFLPKWEVPNTIEQSPLRDANDRSTPADWMVA